MLLNYYFSSLILTKYKQLNVGAIFRAPIKKIGLDVFNNLYAILTKNSFTTCVIQKLVALCVVLFYASIGNTDYSQDKARIIENIQNLNAIVPIFFRYEDTKRSQN